jgi:hypothetical protein
VARKVKRKRTVQKRKTTRRVRQKKKSKNISYLAIIVVIILFVFAIYYFSKGLQQPYQQPSQQPSGTTPTTGGQGAAASVGGFCKKDSECFVAYCKGQAKDCINATQMATYANDNCNRYTDFVVENKQDYSVCACVQYACTLK